MEREDKQMKRYFNWSWCFALWLSFLMLNAHAQEIQVSAKLEHSTIALGDQTKLRLIAHLPQKEQVNFPALSDTISGKIQIVEIGRADTLKDAQSPGFHTISRTYTITSFEPGVHVIPSFLFRGQAGSFSTVSLPLEVKEVKVDTTKAIFDIKQPIAVTYTFMDWLRDNWHWLVFGLAILVMAIILLVYYRKLRKLKPAVVEPPKPQLPPHVYAMEQLQSLRNKKLWQQDAVKEYHIELTDIIREYLEQRYHIHAMEQTSEEIFAALKAMEIHEQDRNRLRQILLLADLVKFAKAKPVSDENEQSMDNAIAFIHGTV